MFDYPQYNQQLSSTLPRTRSATVITNPTPYTSSTYCDNQAPSYRSATEDDLDYTFMHLPVSERRKMFLGQTGQKIYRQQQSMSLPRPSSQAHHYPRPARSDYDWQAEEAAYIQPRQHVYTESTPFMPGRRLSSTGTIILNRPPGLDDRRVYEERRSRSYYQQASPTRVRPAYTDYTASPIYSPERYGTRYLSQPNPRYSTTLRVQNHQAMPASSLYSSRHYVNTQGSGGSVIQPTVVHRSYAQPLRVNVQTNGAVYRPRHSPVRSSQWAGGPVYHAYPASMHRGQGPHSGHYRGSSVPPVAVYSGRRSPGPSRFGRPISPTAFTPTRASPVRHYTVSPSRRIPSPMPASPRYAMDASHRPGTPTYRHRPVSPSQQQTPRAMSPVRGGAVRVGHLSPPQHPGASNF